jgi:hypothetical protein
MGKIKRSLVRTFINTGTPAAPEWALVGQGVTNAKINMNPKVLEETYITEDSATISVESYAPSIPIEATALNTEAVFEYIDAYRKARSVLADVETEICNVWLYEDVVDGFYPAEKQAVSIQVDDFGGEGGSSTKMSYTVNYLGDQVMGIFLPVAAPAIPEFDAEPVDAVLDTMVIGSVTLSPLFSADHYWMLYTGSVANGTDVVSMTSTCSAGGAVVVQYDTHDGVVGQGADASLDVGLNNLTIEVTVGAEVVVYHIDITRAAA